MVNLPGCVICHSSFDAETNIPKSLSCGHTHCIKCIKSLDLFADGVNCPLCNKRTVVMTDERFTVPTNYMILDFIEAQSESGATLFKCVECDASGNINEQHVCITCVTRKYQVEDVVADIEKIPEGINAVVLCASCTIKRHCKQHHNTTELAEMNLDLVHHQNTQILKTLSKKVRTNKTKMDRGMRTFEELVEMCSLETREAVNRIRWSKSHRNYALAVESQKKSLVLLGKTYAYCAIKLTEMNARLVEAFPREAMCLLERPLLLDREEWNFPVRLEPITDSMKFRTPAVFPVDQNIISTDDSGDDEVDVVDNADEADEADEVENIYDPTDPYAYLENDDMQEDPASPTASIVRTTQPHSFNDNGEDHNFLSHLAGQLAMYPSTSQHSLEHSTQQGQVPEEAFGNSSEGDRGDNTTSSPDASRLPSIQALVNLNPGQRPFVVLGTGTVYDGSRVREGYICREVRISNRSEDGGETVIVEANEEPVGANVQGAEHQAQTWTTTIIPSVARHTRENHRSHPY